MRIRNPAWRPLKTAKDCGGVNITGVLGPAVAGLNSKDVNSEVDTGLMSGEEGILFEEGRSAVVGTAAESMTDNDPVPPLTFFFSSAVLLPLSRSSSSSMLTISATKISSSSSVLRSSL